MGATRRLDRYDASTGWQPFFIMSLVGGLIICLGVALQIAQIIASYMQKDRLADTTGDPWDGRNLEWATASPPPSYNFAVIPEVKSRDAFWDMKRLHLPKPHYEDIHMPRNTPAGIYISILAFLAGFGFVWEMNWLAAVSIIAVIVVLVKRMFDEDIEYTIPAKEIQAMEEATIEKNKVRASKQTSDEEDIGLVEFVKTLIIWAFGLVKRGKR